MAIITLTPRVSRLLCGKQIAKNCRKICTTRTCQNFHEFDEKAGYPSKSDYKPEQLTIIQQMRQGYKYLCEELKLFGSEVREKFRMDPIVVNRTGEVDVQWRFDGNPDVLEQWVVSTDSDYGEGNSTASLQLSRTGKGIFSGNLDTRVTRDGKVKVTGYCNLKSVRLRKSFQRVMPLNWGPYNHLVMRVRGDGRNYLLILAAPGEFDILWNDSYQYVLHTRGGPYWQYVRIPFSKFFLSSKGRIQDTQQPPPLQNITSIGFTAADKIPGYFKLEIDWIGVEYDAIYTEDHAYEMYATPHKFHI